MWTTATDADQPKGQKDLRKRIRNTLRRLQAGKLKTSSSIETDEFFLTAHPPGEGRADEHRAPHRRAHHGALHSRVA
jgi:hypothetical protein